MRTLAKELVAVIRAKRPLAAISIGDEERLERALPAALAVAGEATDLEVWDCVNGFSTGRTCDADGGAVAALAALATAPPMGTVLVYDAGVVFETVAGRRWLRMLYGQLRETGGRLLFALDQDQRVPRDLEPLAPGIVAPPPDRDELAEFLAGLPQWAGEIADRQQVELACRGLPLPDVRHVLEAADNSDASLLQGVFREKARLADRAGILQFVEVDKGVLEVGGLAALQDWIGQREDLFTEEQVRAGAPVPKGILIMGVSGCGKSLCAKAVSARWGLPLFRLDLNLVFSGSYGSPEAAFHSALETIEAAAPAVLWIDEIENGFGLTEGGSGGDAQLFSAFLTWMQEKPPLVFVAATANRIEALPAEMIRKGRFDQVFFCDLPDEDDRRDIIKIHLEHHGGKMENFDVGYLAISTEDWSGAEIEQAIVAARVDAMREKRDFGTADVTKHTREMVPLSETMREQIKALRSWAWNRATPASGKRRRM